MTESVLQEAQRIIHGDRAKNYGHPRENFQNIADLWSAYKGVEFTPMDVGLMMVLLKVARLENGEYHRDSVTDIAGYAGTLERIFEEPVGGEPVTQLTADHRDRAWKDTAGWVYKHTANGCWTARKNGNTYRYSEPVGYAHWECVPLTEVVK